MIRCTVDNARIVIREDDTVLSFIMPSPIWADFAPSFVITNENGLFIEHLPKNWLAV